VTSTGYYQVTLDTSQVISTTNIVVGKWEAIQLFYTWTTGKAIVIYIFRDGAMIGSLYNVYTPGFPTFTNTDTLRIGSGFIGQLRRIQIYSPASISPNIPRILKNHLLSSNHSIEDPTKCTVTFGYSNPPICFNSVCGPGFYSSFSSCESICFHHF